MNITENMEIIKKSNDDSFIVLKHGIKTDTIEKSHPAYRAYAAVYNTVRNTFSTERAGIVNEMIANNRYPLVFGAAETMAEAVKDAVTKATPSANKEILVTGISKMMNFFSEFSFVPSFRFTNTFAFMAMKGVKAAREYVSNYFALMDSCYVNEVRQKIKSAEFSTIVDNIKQYGNPDTHINTRFKIYFGSAGTGKTTLAQAEADNRCIVCNSSMLPSDLMEDFLFKDGNPDFNPSLLWDCMEQGKTIVLDEINLLPFDSLRFLQGIVDGKSEFYYKNRPVHIHDGFQIIGTMNLSLGGMTYGLPEPLVDRCSETKEFVLSADQLAKAILRADGE